MLWFLGEARSKIGIDPDATIRRALIQGSAAHHRNASSCASTIRGKAAMSKIDEGIACALAGAAAR
jgi:hypothetical protein